MCARSLSPGGKRGTRRVQKGSTMKKALIILLMWCITIPWTLPALSCTTIIAGKNATSDGSIIVAHSDDNDMADQRIVYVSARDYPEGAMRNVYYDPCSLGPNEKYNDSWWCRYAGPDRGPAYVDLDRPRAFPWGAFHRYPIPTPISMVITA